MSFAKIEGANDEEVEVHLNSYDPVMDMVTNEGGVVDGFERDKNQVLVPIRRDDEDICFQLSWRFMRGVETKNIFAKIHIKLENSL